ncbi:MAG: hypothetical protein WC836_10455 [Desulfobacula sp.]|jgi:hypothetical protein
MKIHLHKNAKTTPAQRAFIRASIDLDTAELALKLGISQTTVRKWKKRTSVYDRPHIPHKIPSVLTPLQEILVILTRLCLRPGLDDLHHIVRRFIHPGYARSSLNRCLKRYHISRLDPLPVHLPDPISGHRGIFLYYTAIHLPDLFKTGNCEFLHIFLDCTTRWIYMDMTPASYLHDPSRFIRTISASFPSVILGMIAGGLVDLSDKEMGTACQNHSRFIQNLCKGLQSFRVMADHGHAITRELIENTRLSDTAPDGVSQIESFFEFKNLLLDHLTFYNTRLCLRSLKQKTPAEAINCRYKIFPGSFWSRPE